MMHALDKLRYRFNEFELRERLLLSLAALLVVATLFYLLAWEPLFTRLQQEQQRQHNLRTTLAWMHEAAAEVSTLKNGRVTTTRRSSQPVSILVEQGASSSGLKSHIDKLEASSRDDVRVKLDAVSFDQMLLWLNTLEKRHGIKIASASIERAEKDGTVNARLTFKRS